MAGGARGKGHVEHDLRLGPGVVDQLTQGGGQPQIVQRRRAHPGDHPPQFAHQRAGLPCSQRKIGRVAIDCEVQPPGERGGALRDAIMKLVGDPAALGLLRAEQFGQQRGKPRLARPRRKRSTDQLSENAERFAVIGAGRPDALIEDQRADQLAAAPRRFERHDEAVRAGQPLGVRADNDALCIACKMRSFGGDLLCDGIEFARRACSEHPACLDKHPQPCGARLGGAIQRPQVGSCVASGLGGED